MCVYKVTNEEAIGGFETNGADEVDDAAYLVKKLPHSSLVGAWEHLVFPESGHEIERFLSLAEGMRMIDHLLQSPGC